jgi:hypothetical protein
MRVLLGQIISDVDELALVLQEAREQITGGQRA